MRDIDPFKAPLHSVQLRGMYFICRFANMSSCHASNVVRKSSTLYQVLDCWTAPLRMFVLNPRSLWETKIAAEIAHNSRASCFFHEQIFPDPRLVLCANVSYAIRKIWCNFQRKVGGDFAPNSRRISPAAGSY